MSGLKSELITLIESGYVWSAAEESVIIDWELGPGYSHYETRARLYKGNLSNNVDPISMFHVLPAYWAVT